MKSFINKYKTIIILLFITLVVIVIGWISFRTFVFQAISVFPSNNSKVSGGSVQVVMTFNKELEAINAKNQISYSNGLSLSSKTEKNKLTLYIASISQGQSYFVEIKDIKSTSGDYIASYRYNFKAEYVPFNQLSKEEQQQQITTTDTGITYDPATKFLPVYKDHYTIEYQMYQSNSQKGKNISLKIILMLNNFNFDNKQVAAQYKQESLNFLKSQGINPDDYVIQWVPEYASSI